MVNAGTPVNAEPLGSLMDVNVLWLTKINDAKAVQFVHTLLPMVVTDDGMVKVVNDVHPANKYVPSIVTDDGMVKVVNDVQCVNAYIAKVVM
jgi:hypothetical protein